VAAHRDDLNFEVIFTAPPYVLLAEDHPLTDRESVSLAQLVDEPLILFSLPPGGDAGRRQADPARGGLHRDVPNGVRV
jgi:DNA-binding transcriptional LysR family regulator